MLFMEVWFYSSILKKNKIKKSLSMGLFSLIWCFVFRFELQKAIFDSCSFEEMFHFIVPLFFWQMFIYFGWYFSEGFKRQDQNHGDWGVCGIGPEKPCRREDEDL